MCCASRTISTSAFRPNDFIGSTCGPAGSLLPNWTPPRMAGFLFGNVARQPAKIIRQERTTSEVIDVLIARLQAVAHENHREQRHDTT
jgi:hypothetical protein